MTILLHPGKDLRWACQFLFPIQQTRGFMAFFFLNLPWCSNPQYWFPEEPRWCRRERCRLHRFVMMPAAWMTLARDGVLARLPDGEHIPRPRGCSERRAGLDRTGSGVSWRRWRRIVMQHILPACAFDISHRPPRPGGASAERSWATSVKRKSDGASTSQGCGDKDKDVVDEDELRCASVGWGSSPVS